MKKTWGKDEDIITQLGLCKKLLKRIRNDQYAEEQLIPVEEKIWRIITYYDKR